MLRGGIRKEGSCYKYDHNKQRRRKDQHIMLGKIGKVETKEDLEREQRDDGFDDIRDDHDDDDTDADGDDRNFQVMVQYWHT